MTPTMTITRILADAFRNTGSTPEEAKLLAAVAVAALDPWPAGWWCTLDAEMGAPPWSFEECETDVCEDMPVWVLRRVKEL